MAIVTAQTNIKVDSSELRKHLAIWSHVMGKTAEETVRTQAGLLCQDMLSYTLPISGQPGGRRGEGLDAREVGERSMEADIDRIFKPLEDASFSAIADQGEYGVFAEWVAAKEKAGKEIPKYVSKGVGGYVNAVKVWDRFRTTYAGKRVGKVGVFSTFQGDGIEEAHQRIRGGTNVDDYSKNVKARNTTFFVGDYDKNIKSYKSKMKEHVGRLKAGWLEAGLSIGRHMRAPAWISRHVGQGTGIYIDQTSNKQTPTIIIGNSIHGKMTQSPGKDLWKTAVNYRAYAMRNDIAKRLERATKGSGIDVREAARRLGIAPGDILQ
jgi:hypothetical protein